MDTISWLFVDEEGNECITNDKPLRVKDHLNEYTNRVDY